MDNCQPASGLVIAAMALKSSSSSVSSSGGDPEAVAVVCLQEAKLSMQGWVCAAGCIDGVDSSLTLDSTRSSSKSSRGRGKASPTPEINVPKAGDLQLALLCLGLLQKACHERLQLEDQNVCKSSSLFWSKHAQMCFMEHGGDCRRVIMAVVTEPST
jgi:hypothetical protein